MQTVSKYHFHRCTYRADYGWIYWKFCVPAWNRPFQSAQCSLGPEACKWKRKRQKTKWGEKTKRRRKNIADSSGKALLKSTSGNLLFDVYKGPIRKCSTLKAFRVKFYNMVLEKQPTKLIINIITDSECSSASRGARGGGRRWMCCAETAAARFTRQKDGRKINMQ